MLFDDELAKAGDANEILIQTRIPEALTELIDSYEFYFRTRISFIESAMRSFLSDFSRDYKILEKEITPELVKQSGNDKGQAISALFKTRPYHITGGRNTVQVNLKISKKFAMDLRTINDLTLQINDTPTFINYCCTYLLNSSFIAANAWLEGYYSFDKMVGKTLDTSDKDV